MPTDVLDRLQAERLHHDRQAAERAESFRRGRAELRFTDDAYLDHESWIRPAMARLGAVRDRDVLDYGCGHGMAAVVLARAGARVTAFDLSPGYVEEAQARARANEVTVRCLTAAAESLPFPDANFDAVWGCAILHHVKLDEAARELYRVLRPGGVAVFCEPWGENPLLRFARAYLPYPGKDRTRGEKPLRRCDLAPLLAAFSNLHIEGHQLLGMVRRLAPRVPFSRHLDACDRRLIRLIPHLQKFCRYVVLTLRRGYDE